MKGSCLEILLKIAGFHNFAKSREKLMFGDFLEIISGLSLMSYVKSRETLVFERFLKMISGLSQLCKVS